VVVGDVGDLPHPISDDDPTLARVHALHHLAKAQRRSVPGSVGDTRGRMRAAVAESAPNKNAAVDRLPPTETNRGLT